MDLAQTLTLIGVAIANIGTTITLFLWATNHAAEDRRALETSMGTILKAIQDEMKDFHGRLCSIEERNKLQSHD